MTRRSGYRDTAIQAFKKYLSDCKTDGHLSNNLCNINWEIVDDDDDLCKQINVTVDLT